MTALAYKPRPRPLRVGSGLPLGEHEVDTPGCLLSQARRIPGWAYVGHRATRSQGGRVRRTHVAFWFERRASTVIAPRASDFAGGPGVTVCGGTYFVKGSRAVLWLTVHVEERGQ